MEKKKYLKPLYENESVNFDDVLMASGLVQKSDQSHSIYNSDIKI